MPSVRKAAARRRRKRRASPITIQVHFLIRRPRRVKITAQFLRAVFEEWINSGDEPQHIKVVYIQWRHENKRGGENEHPGRDGIEDSRIKLRAIMQASNKSTRTGETDHLYLRALVS